MTESSQSTPATASVEVPISDPHGWEEPEDFTVRQQLGLRPIFYPVNESPDPGECPDWCWLPGVANITAHEIDHEHPFIVHHTSEPIEIALTHYDGAKEYGRLADGSDVRGVATATLEVTVKQDGDKDNAELWLDIRGAKGAERLCKTVLVLSPDDAADLITVLGHLIGRIDANERLNSRERNAFEIGRDVGRGGDVS